MLTTKIVTMSAAGILLAGPSLAGSLGYATADVNLRAGPSPSHAIIGVIRNRDETVVESCLANSNWCRVNYRGIDGWAYGNYLSVPASVQVQPRIVTYEQPRILETESVTYNEEAKQSSGVAAGILGAAAGALVGGPVGAVAGGAIGGATGAAVAPAPHTVTYIRSNPVEPVYLSGDVVVGTRIPEGVTFYEVPNSPYGYVNVNDTRVLVDPADRTVVYVNR